MCQIYKITCLISSEMWINNQHLWIPLTFSVSIYKLICITQCTPLCWLSQLSGRLTIGRSWVRTLAASYQKTLKDGSCCYLVCRSTIEKDRATSIWRCSVAAGPTINWAKRISISDNKIWSGLLSIIIIIIIITKDWNIPALSGLTFLNLMWKMPLVHHTSSCLRYWEG